MSYNGSGTFIINSTGQPVVAGTVITSSAFNALTTDLANGLSTAITKDGQTTVTNNIPLNNFKVTSLGAGTALTDAAQLAQVQSGASILLTVTGTDTYAGTATPTPTAYAAGNVFTFVVPNTNTGPATLNVNALGAKTISRDGSTALVAGDLVAGSEVVVVYDGTQFQVLNSNSKTNLHVSNNATVDNNVTVGNNATVTNALSAGSASLTTPLPVTSGGIGVSTITGLVKGNGTSAVTAAVAGTDYAAPTSGTSILYGNGAGGFSNVTIGSNLTFAGGVLAAPSSGGMTLLATATPVGSSSFRTTISFTGLAPCKTYIVVFSVCAISISGTMTLTVGDSIGNTTSIPNVFGSNVSAGVLQGVLQIYNVGGALTGNPITVASANSATAKTDGFAWAGNQISNISLNSYFGGGSGSATIFVYGIN